MRLNAFDPSNGYFGKIDPMEYLGKSVLMSQTFVQAVSWQVTMKAGERVALGYRYKAPEISPALYFLGPVRMTTVAPVALVLGSQAPPSTAQASDSAQLSEGPLASASAQLPENPQATQSAALPSVDLLPMNEASGSAVASQSAEIAPPETPTPTTTVFSDVRRWQVVADQVLHVSKKGMSAVVVNADTQPNDFLIQDPQDKQLKSFVVDNTSATKTVTYKSLRGTQKQVYKDNDVTELTDNNQLASVGVVTPQYWNTDTNTWEAYPRISATKSDFKKANSDKKRVRFDDSIQNKLGLGATFERKLRTVTSGDTPAMKEDWKLTGAQKKRIMWEIQLKNFVLTQSRENIMTKTEDGTVRSINEATYGDVHIVAPYNGNMSWNEDATTNTVRIYFEPDGVSGDLVIDPTMSATSTSTTVTVTSSGVYKIRFNSAPGMADQLFLPDTDTTNRLGVVSSADMGICIRDYSTFDTFTTFTTSSIALSESSSVRVVVTGTWTNSSQDATNVKFYLYPDRVTVNEPIHTTSAFSGQYKPIVFTMLASLASEYKQFNNTTLDGSWTTIPTTSTWTFTNLTYTTQAAVVRTHTATADPKWYVGYWTYTPRETSVLQNQTYGDGTLALYALGDTSVSYTAGSTKTDYYQFIFQNGSALDATFQHEGQDYWNPFYTAVTGTKVTSDTGDANTDGYNEGQGYYSMQADGNNTVQVSFSDTRGASTAYTYYDPVIKITNWTWSGAAVVEKSTDNGTTWTTLTAGTDYNITQDSDEAQVGTNTRYFQYLGTVSGSGAATTHFRITWQPDMVNLMRHGKAFTNGVYYPFTF